MRVLFSPFGSEGDVNPLLWLAGLLAERGHHVEFLLTPHYGHLADQRGFAWHPMGTGEDFLRTANDPALWKPGIGTWLVARVMCGSLPAYQKAFESSGGKFDLVVTSSFGLAATALAEARGIPRLMLHLQPMCLRSHRDLPVSAVGWAWLRHAPKFLQDAVFLCVDGILNTALLPPLNRFRGSLGLPPLRDFYRDALMRANGLALLSPEWFAPPQPDWPKDLRQFDFPPGAPSPLPPDLLDWLGSGEPPVLWTHGSANVHLAKAHALARETTRQIGGRALLVGKTAPAFALPDGLFYYPHVAFEDVFPRCRAVVHHGGIGTTAKAFAAGIPQLVLPLAHDQHDNAARVERLQAGLEGRPRDASRKLRALLASCEIATGVEKCRLLAAPSPSRAASLADWAEELAR
ncbi:MAG: glycosyltransferase [Verrucomicrobiae bacterium]